MMENVGTYEAKNSEKERERKYLVRYIRQYIRRIPCWCSYYAPTLSTYKTRDVVGRDI